MRYSADRAKYALRLLSRHTAIPAAALLLFVTSFTMAPAAASQTLIQNFDGGGQAVCPCFIENERAGVVLQAPAQDYPLKILQVGIAWGSYFNGNPAQVERSIRLYEGGLPNPGVHIFELLGPQMTDGFINVFNIDPLPGNKTIDSGPFTIAIEFFNQSSGNFYASSVVHDANGCQPGKNVVYALPGGWADACVLGVTGDWVMYAVYETVTATGVEERMVASAPAFLAPASPNPFGGVTEAEVFLAEAGRASVAVYDVRGRRVARILDTTLSAGTHRVSWDGRDQNGEALSSGVYFMRLQAAGHTQVRKLALTR